MNNLNRKDDVTPTWFVSARFDQTDHVRRFLAQGVWEIKNPADKEAELIRSMQPGERIAIKASYARRRGLEFDSHGRSVPAMGIKALGTIRANPQDGKRVQVQWQPVDPVREWYFHIDRETIWRVLPGDWMDDALLAFAFEDKPQELERFRNAPSWHERYGTFAAGKQRFQWTDFYEAVAERLLDHAEDRTFLIQGIHQIAHHIPGLNYLQERTSDGSSGPLQDICPFTAMGAFNRSMTDATRKIVAGELAKLLGVSVPVPTSFEGIPVLNNQRSWFFAHVEKRGADDINALWRVFAAANQMVGSEAPDTEAFIQAFDHVINRVRGVAWNLTTGLYWAHPWDFLMLDSQSRPYINKRLGLNVSLSGQRGLSAHSYLKLRDDLRQRFGDEVYPIHSFPELSLASWLYKNPIEDSVALAIASTGAEARHAIADETPLAYSADDILKDGCFLARDEIALLLDRLRTKKNLVLQGPPGTGKTWLAKRLAFALMGRKDDSKVRVVQFHPTLSYEDFVRGWRPTGDGSMALIDGVFMEAVKAAERDRHAKVVVVIEEINRGNPVQIFGELLTLLEADKRTPSEALELCLPSSGGKRRPLHIPENLYVIGTMNIADHALARVDVALRRRFAFVDLEPKLGEPWRDWVVGKCGVDPILAADVELRINTLNKRIAADVRLGKQFQIGHSYVTPTHPLPAGETRKWFREVVETEIGPLLEEYWCDTPEEAREAKTRLTRGW